MKETLSLEVADFRQTAMAGDALEYLNAEIVEPAVGDFVSDIEGVSSEQVRAFVQEADRILWPTVAAHADIIVCCERLGGREMTLSQAINAIWPISDKGAMVKEGLSSVMAEVQSMLISRPIEAEKPEKKEEEPEEEVQEEAATPKGGNSKTEKAELKEEKIRKRAENKPDIVQEIVSSKNAVSESEQTNAVAATSESGAAKRTANGVAAKSNLALDQSETESSTSAPEIISKRTEVIEKFISANETDLTLEPAELALEAAVELELFQATLAKVEKVEELPLEATSLAVKEDNVEDVDEIFIAEETKPKQTISIEPELLVKPELTETKMTEEAEQAEVYEPPNFIEGEAIQIEHFDEFEVEEPDIELEALVGDALVSEDLESIDFMIVDIHELPTVVDESLKEAEALFAELAEQMATSEPEKVKEVNEILSAIIEIPAKLEDESILSEEEAQTELEVLFTELFDVMEIEYTPELAESLAKLTLKWHLVEEIKKIRKEDNELKAQDGTNEIIKKILVALSKIKKAILHAGSIGRSAMRLYIFGFQTQAA